MSRQESSNTNDSEAAPIPMAEALAATQEFFDKAIRNNADLFNNNPFDPFGVTQTYMEAMLSIWRAPDTAMQAQSDFLRDSIQLWQYAAKRAMGQEADPVISPAKGDKRWRDDDWSETLVFDYIKQSYLLAARCLQTSVSGVDELDAQGAKKLEFFTRQITDALAPTNFPATNPAVLRQTAETRGQNLVDGLKNFKRDLESSDGKLRIAMTDPDAFTLGENVAASPGKVVFQNRMFQLIQYAPSTGKVVKKPLLIVPPWINKFYVLDLQPKNSLIKWMVDAGHTVFVVSWVNPDESYSDVDFDNYVMEGIYPAVDAVELATGEKEINIVGYCIGGTLLAIALAHMKASGDQRINSATFFTALVDFEDAGDLTVFIDEEQVSQLEEKMGQSGYLEGNEMSDAFNMLRSNDLIWSFYINNYLMGRDPSVFDLLYWNSDSTRLPAKMHSTYLRNMYLENKLVEPGAFEVDGVGVDLSTVDVPCYFISTHDDHIAPWKCTYRGARLFAGPVRFTLGGSGHIAGIVNPPEANKYCYWTGTDEMPEQPDEWLAAAEQHDGSWWNDWNKWLRKRSRALVPARGPGESVLEVIEDAPGSYVAQRI